MSSPGAQDVGAPLTGSGYAVELQGISHSFSGNAAVRALSFRVPEGIVCGFLGPNGAGKTTTLRMITGLLWPDQGQVRLLGGLTPEQARRQLSYLPEERGIYRRMKVLETLIYFGRLRGMDKAEAATRARRWLHRFGLAHALHAPCESLSKGMIQKLQIVIALLHEPRLLVLDEPFSGLDPAATELLQETIRELRDAGCTIILSTHLLQQAEHLCDHAILLNQGRLLAAGPTRSICARSTRSIHVDYQGNGEIFKRLPGVSHVHDTGVHAELSLSDHADTDMLLRTMAEHVSVQQFTLNRASLHEVFMQMSGARS